MVQTLSLVSNSSFHVITPQSVSSCNSYGFRPWSVTLRVWGATSRGYHLTHPVYRRPRLPLSALSLAARSPLSDETMQQWFLNMRAECACAAGPVGGAGAESRSLSASVNWPKTRRVYLHRTGRDKAGDSHHVTGSPNVRHIVSTTDL